MTPSEEQIVHADALPPESVDAVERERAAQRIGTGADLVRFTLAGVTGTAQEAAPPAERKLRALQALRERESAWLSPHDFDLQVLESHVLTHELPPAERVFLTAKDVRHATGLQAVVLSQGMLRLLDYVAYVTPAGQVRVVTPRDVAADDACILLPADLGDTVTPEQPDDPERAATRALLDMALALREGGYGPVTRDVFLQATGNREVHITRADLICHPRLEGYIEALVETPDGPEEMRMHYEEILPDHGLRLTAMDFAE